MKKTTPVILLMALILLVTKLKPVKTLQSIEDQATWLILYYLWAPHPLPSKYNL